MPCCEDHRRRANLKGNHRHARSCGPCPRWRPVREWVVRGGRPVLVCCRDRAVSCHAGLEPPTRARNVQTLVSDLTLRWVEAGGPANTPGRLREARCHASVRQSCRSRLDLSTRVRNRVAGDTQFSTKCLESPGEGQCAESNPRESQRTSEKCVYVFIRCSCFYVYLFVS